MRYDALVYDFSVSVNSAVLIFNNQYLSSPYNSTCSLSFQLTGIGVSSYCIPDKSFLCEPLSRSTTTSKPKVKSPCCSLGYSLSTRITFLSSSDINGYPAEPFSSSILIFLCFHVYKSKIIKLAPGVDKAYLSLVEIEKLRPPGITPS